MEKVVLFFIGNYENNALFGQEIVHPVLHNEYC